MFTGVSPELVWGLIPRFVGFIYVLAFAAIAPQVDLTIGSRGLCPLDIKLSRIRRDYPGLRRFFDYPNLFWLNASDAVLHAAPVVGALCGVLAMYGGPWGYAALVVGWLIWLSFEPAGLIFPWDTMLQEVGFLVLFLPFVAPLPDLHTTALPLPVAAFSFRWLVLRLMLGFGKVKFIGTTKSDALYLQGFFVWAPLPSPIGWFAHHAPHWLHKASLAFMFFGEVIAPTLGFFSGPLRIVSFVSLTCLMIGIQLTGNWGYFNIGYVLLATCLLDTQSSIFDVFQEPWLSRALTPQDLVFNGSLAVLFVLTLVAFAFNSWVSRTWVHWPWEDGSWNQPWVHKVLPFFKAFAPFRIANAYGVFPPYAQAPTRMVPVLEGSDDGVTYHAYGYRYMPSRPDERAPFVAPHHPRLDQALYYAGAGIQDGSFFGSIISDGTPYSSYAHSSWLDRVAQRLLEGDPMMLRALGHNPFPNAPPKYVRVSSILMTPTSMATRRETGDWWRIRRLGQFMPPRTLGSWAFGLTLPEPEAFHPDLLDYRRRSLPLRRITEAFAAGKSADEAVLVESDLTAREVEEFWSTLVPELARERGDWSHIHERAQGLLRRYGIEQLARFERLLERYAWLMRGATEKHHIGGAEPKIALKSTWRYHMFLHETVIDGRDLYLAQLASPETAAARAAATTDQTQLWTLGMLRYDLMMMHVCAFRWSEMGKRCYDYDGPGIFEYYPLLAEIIPPDEEFCPKGVRLPNGEFLIEGFYPLAPARDEQLADAQN